MNSSDDKADMMDQGKAVATPKSISRRSLLTSSVKAMPVVLTLHSGAALARSSNLITGTITPEVDADGRTLCLNTGSVTDLGGGTYDLGEPPYAEVYAIRERDYRLEPNGGADPITEAEICEMGQPGYFKNPNWGAEHNVQVTQGMLVSSAHLTSFAGRNAIHLTDL